MREKVMAAGHLCLDITPRFGVSEGLDIGRVFSPGRLTNVREAVISTGGSVSNTGLAVAKLGCDVLLNGKIGDDAFGDIIRRLIPAHAASTLRTVSGQASSYTIVLAPPGVDRFFLHYPAANDSFGAEDIDYTAAAACNLFHFGYPPLMSNMFQNQGRELVEMYTRLKSLALTTSLDMAMPDPASPSGRTDWKLILQNVAPYVDLLLPSIDEITFMLDRPLFEKTKARPPHGRTAGAYPPHEVAKISDTLLSMGFKIVLLKCGVAGAFLRTASADRIAAMGKSRPSDVESWSDRQIWAPSFSAENFASALGAGDSTVAGFLCALIRGFSPEDSLTIANILGWQNVHAVDALTGITDFDTVLQILKSPNMPRNQIPLQPPDWTYSKTHKLYHGPQDRK